MSQYSLLYGGNMSLILGILGLLLGIAMFAGSLTAKIVTGEHAATLACACFLFVIAVGVWRDNPK